MFILLCTFRPMSILQVKPNMYINRSKYVHVGLYVYIYVHVCSGLEISGFASPNTNQF